MKNSSTISQTLYSCLMCPYHTRKASKLAYHNIYSINIGHFMVLKGTSKVRYIWLNFPSLKQVVVETTLILPYLCQYKAILRISSCLLSINIKIITRILKTDRKVKLSVTRLFSGRLFTLSLIFS